MYAFALVLLYFALWLVEKIARLVFSQEKQDPNPISSCTRAFSRAWRWLRIITSNSDWFTELSSSVVIGHSNCFGFGFTTFNFKTALSCTKFHCFIVSLQINPAKAEPIRVPENQRSFVVGGLKPYTRYQFSISARNSIGTSAKSPVVTFTTRQSREFQESLCCPKF